MNLCTNAYHAMRDTGGTLKVGLLPFQLGAETSSPHPALQPGNYMVMTVSDTGSGIPADVLPRIFDPFFTTHESAGGTGLGLSTILGIVNGWRGAIDVYTLPGEGTEFEILIPSAPKAP